MKSLNIFLILIYVCYCESATVEDIIEICLIKILKFYFPHQPVLLITDLTIDRQPFRVNLLPNLEKEYHRQIIGNIMEKKKWTLQIYNTDKYIGLPAKMKLDKLKNCFFFIRTEIMASDVLFDWEMDRLHKNPLWNPTGKTLIVVKNGKAANNSADLARRIIEKMWTKSKAVDNLVMVAEDSGAVHFYTWFPYRQPDCSQVKQVVLLDTFRKGRLQRKAHLFPEKIEHDLQSCELVAATDACIPYVFADANNASKFVSGLEVRIVNTLSDILNFSLITVRPANMWTTTVNKSLTGAFKLLVEQKVDIAFSCLMLNPERNLLALALPSYYEDSLIWFVPSPTYKTHVGDIFYSFPVNFWLAMWSVMTIAVVIVVLLSYNERVVGSVEWGTQVAVVYVLRLVGVSLYAPVNIPTKKINLRLFAFVFFFYSMHITIAFQSSLFALYQQPQYNRFYSSLEQAVDAGLFVYLRSSTQELYNQSDHDLWNKILRPGRFDYLKDFGEVFSEIAYDKTAIALFIKTTGIHMISVYFTDDLGTPQILWLSQKFAPYPVTMYMSPGNPLFRIFEKQIHRIMVSGLIRIWLKRAVMGKELRWARNEYANRPLTMKHVEGAFLLLLFLLGFAVLAFFGEISVFYVKEKIKKRKKPKHRHFFPPMKSKSFDSKAVTFVRVGNGGQKFF